MSDLRVWVDGARVDPAGPAVSAVDHGVTVGDGAFETAKIEYAHSAAASPNGAATVSIARRAASLSSRMRPPRKNAASM